MTDPITPQMAVFFWLVDQPALSGLCGVLLGFLLNHVKRAWMRYSALVLIAIAPLIFVIMFGGHSAFGVAMTLFVLTPLWFLTLIVGMLIDWFTRGRKTRRSI